MQGNSQELISFRDFIPLMTTIIGAFFVFLGWYATHWLNSIRDRKNKNREIRLQYLIEVYRAFVDANGRDLKEEPEFAHRLEAAVRDIQLIGSDIQIKRLKEAIENHQNNIDSETTLIIQSLRDELRKELDLPEVKSKITWLTVKTIKPKSISKRRN